MTREYGAPSETMDRLEYQYKLTNQQIPPLLEAASKKIEPRKPHVVYDAASDITIEKVVQAFGGGDPKWKLSFYVSDKKVVYECTARYRSHHPSGWHITGELDCSVYPVPMFPAKQSGKTSISAKMTEQLMKDIAVAADVDVERQFGLTQSYRRTKPQVKVRNPAKVNFLKDKNVAWWECACWFTGETECEHLYKYWAAGEDARDLRLFGVNRSKSWKGEYKYLLAGSLITVRLTGQLFDAQEVFGEEQPRLVQRLSYRDELSIWLEDGAASRDIIDQLLAAASARTSIWQKVLTESADLKKLGLCTDKRHGSTHNSRMAAMFAKASPTDKNNILLANAYYSTFDKLCMFCGHDRPWENDEERAARLAKDAAEQYSQF